MRIYLMGYMGSGKTTLGRRLALSLGFSFLDLDDMFEDRYHISVVDFFEKYDEKAFRTLERSLLQETLNHDDVVVSTGGGTPCFFDNIDFITEAGISLYLYWEIPSLVERLKQVKRKRPLLKDLDEAELENTVTRQIEQRSVYYSQADYTIRMKHLEMDTLLEWLRSRLQLS